MIENLRNPGGGGGGAGTFATVTLGRTPIGGGGGAGGMLEGFAIVDLVESTVLVVLPGSDRLHSVAAGRGVIIGSDI